MDSSAPVAVQSTVWYPDGNIILQTGQGTTDAPFTRFRVYKGILADKSSVFKDMLFVAGDGEGNELVDGCPLVRLDDGTVELEHVLRALHMDPKYHNWDDAIPVSAVAGFIRLGRKYDIPQLRSSGLARFYYEVPTTYDDNEELDDRDHWTKIQQVPDIDVAILKIALECDLRAALPRAYYACSFKTITELLAAGLPPEILATCLLGREKIITCQWAYHLDWVERTYRAKKCERRAACDKAKLDIVADVHRSDSMSKVIGLTEWDSFGELMWDDELCDICSAAGAAHYDKRMEKLWDALPGFFDLPAWDILLKDKDA